MTSNGSATSTRVLQVSNISPSASKDQLYSLFAFLGRIDEYRMYPSDGSQSVQKFAYFKFDRASSVELGQHLTNTVFIDRALVCVPAPTSTIPDEETALRSGPILPGQRQLPPNVVTSKQADADGQEMLYTNDPQMAALGLPPYPPLPVGTEPSKVEEIRRTVYIGGLKKGTNGQDLINFLNATIGEVMYLRMTAENEHLPCSYAYVEFSSQSSVPLALQNNGIEFDGVPLKIQHSKVAIVKPQQKTADQALEEVEEAIRHNEGRLDPPAIVRGHSPAHSSRSGSRRRSPSPPPRRRSPSPPPRRRDSRDYSPVHRSRDRTPERSPRYSRDRERSPRRHRSRSRSPRRRSKERKSKREDRREGKSSKHSKSDRRRSRSRTPKKEKSRKKHSRSRSPSQKRSKKDRHKDEMLQEEEELRRRLKEKMGK